MIIRIANDNDIDNNLLKLYIEGFNMHYENRKDIFIKKTNEELKKDLINVLKSREKIILVIEVDNIIIGYATFQCKNKVSNSFWIDEIIIDENYRNQGYGKKLIDELSIFAKKHNCQRIELNCWSFNKDALKFYEKIGFTQQRIIFEKEV